MLRHLAARHDVTLVSFTRDDDPPEALAHLQEICSQLHTITMRRSVWRNVRAGIRGLFTSLPMTIVRDEIDEMAMRVCALAKAEAFDVVHADQLSMAWWGQVAVRAAAAVGRTPRTLLDEHNAVHLLASRMATNERNPLRRILMQREARAFGRYERVMCRTYDAVLTVTDEDRAHLLALTGELDDGRWAGDEAQATSNNQHRTSHITVLPICVDPERTAIVPRQPGGQPTILHLGTMFWPPNVTGVLWFAREVLPRVHAQMPDARFVIVGKNPPPEVQALTADKRIEVAGYVPDATPYLAATDVFVVPLHAGGGMRVKILDAWLWGQPVVATAVGAEGINVRDGENILIADEPDAFAAATLRLLVDPILNARVRAAGRAWVEETYAWQRVYRRVDEVYVELLTKMRS